MDGGGFEPPKQFAADLQSVPFGHSGIHPCAGFSQTLTIYIYNIPLSELQEIFSHFLLLVHRLLFVLVLQNYR